MPKRSNLFQRMVALIEAQLVPMGARVTESGMVKDPLTGEDRETDVSIEICIGVHNVAIAVECRDRNRPADLTWIDQLIGKYQGTGIKVVAVSRSGFTRRAREKALMAGFEVRSLEEAGKAEWVKVVNRLGTIRIESFLLPHVTRVRVLFDEAKVQRGSVSTVSLREAVLVLPDGSEAGTLKAYVDSLERSPEFIQAAAQHGYPDSASEICARIAFRPGTHIRSAVVGDLPVHALELTALCRKETTVVPVVRAGFLGAEIAFGEAATFGAPASVVVMERPGEQTTVSFSVPKKLAGSGEAPFVAISGSGVFHRATCACVRSKSGTSLVRYASREQSLKDGKRGCRRCRP